MTSKPITYSVSYPVTKSNVYTVASQSGTTPVLNNLSVSATAAYGLRKLRQAYSGSAIRVRRSSDNQELNIGFTASGAIDRSALTTFVGANNGFITTWYDQVGSNNFTQTTASSQPEIVNAGTVRVDVAGNPQLYFNGTSHSMAATYTIPYPFSQNFVANPSSTQQAFGMLLVAGPSITEYRASGVFNFFENVVGAISNLQDTGNSLGIRRISTTFASTSAQSTYTNGVNVGVNTFLTLSGNAVSNPSIGQRGTAGGFFYTGGISEVMFFGSILSTANRQTLERNQGQYYGIVVA
jgi:hypothetical protein